MAGSSWPPPLAANTPAHVASALPDPLGALTAGEIPAIVIKRLIQPQLAAALAHNVELAIAAPPLASFVTVSPSRSHVRLGAKPYNANTSTSFGEMTRRARLQPAVDALLRAVTTLAAGRRVGAGANFSTAGAFSKFMPGDRYAPHADTLHAVEWYDHCKRASQRERDYAKSLKDKVNRIPDAARMKVGFSAVLALAATPGVDAVVFDDHWEKLAKECSDDERLRGNALNWVNVRFPWGFGEAAGHRRANVTLDAGDFYLFHSNRVHQVQPVEGTAPRVTYSAFLGVDEKEVRVWGYS